ncbi:MAG: PA4642 family protein [Pseudomonadales bacterium]
MRADKKKVVDEVWDDERIESFLSKGSMGTESDDYSILLNAYRSMRVEDFLRFLPLYSAAGHSLDAADSAGTTLLATVRTHRNSAAFAEALEAAGATG